MKTLFEKIIAGDLPSEKVYEDATVIAIKDKYPKAPVHFLIIPKKVIPDLQSLEEKDYPLLGHIVKIAQKLAIEYDLLDSGYRFLVNNGADAGQTIPHLHFHLMGGRQLGEMG